MKYFFLCFSFSNSNCHLDFRIWRHAYPLICILLISHIPWHPLLRGLTLQNCVNRMNSAHHLIRNNALHDSFYDFEFYRGTLRQSDIANRLLTHTKRSPGDCRSCISFFFYFRFKHILIFCFNSMFLVDFFTLSLIILFSFFWNMLKGALMRRWNKPRC